MKRGQSLTALKHVGTDPFFLCIALVNIGLSSCKFFSVPEGKAKNNEKKTKFPPKISIMSNFFL
ncbi:hypothetical protein GS18_0213820 [Metabacillus indicus]|uniref:Lipoprotein n=1 Tax=Metabacillus indicus TaxID=246786 RepID=A0A084GXU2_METID|nr:hypothetical protein GS18_0213820 [Metabacillus indicus]